MPATRIGRTVIFPGGETVILSQWERLLFKLGARKTMRRPPRGYGSEARALR